MDFYKSILDHVEGITAPFTLTPRLVSGYHHETLQEMSFIEVSRRIEKEQRVKFCGTASIRLTSLRFNPECFDGKALNRASVEPLKRMFREEKGCRREDNRHHAKATISQETLDAILAKAGIDSERIRDAKEPYPELELPSDTQLECLQRYDRVLAAEETLGGTGRRWIVDLFLDDISDELKRLFIEEYDYQRAPDDGKFYRKIRQYQGIRGTYNPYFERLWLGQLAAVSKNRRNLFEQLKSHDTFLRAFDALLDIPALFCGFRLTVVHQMIGMRCEELIVSYLNHVRETWSQICSKDSQRMRRIDREMIEALQGTAPGGCLADQASLDQVKGNLLAGFSSEERDEIWTQVSMVSRRCVIPSLYTFFEDLKLLKLAADSMRRLMHIGSRDTILGCLEGMFSDVNQESDRCFIQMSEGRFATIAGDEGIRINLGCRQCWLAVIRECRDLPREPQKKNILAKPRTRANEITVFSIASLFSRLGFESDQIRKLLESSPERDVAERCLLDVRRPDQFRYSNLDLSIQQLTKIFATAEPIPAEQLGYTDTEGDCYEEPVRYGIPRDTDQRRDKSFLFLPSLHQDSELPMARMTSFFVLQSFYFAFFGRDLPTGVDLTACQDAGLIHLATSQPDPTTTNGREDELARQRDQLTELTRDTELKQARLDLLSKEELQKRKELEALEHQIQQARQELDRSTAEDEEQHRAKRQRRNGLDTVPEAKGLEPSAESGQSEKVNHSPLAETEESLDAVDTEVQDIATEDATTHARTKSRRVTQFDFSETASNDTLSASENQKSPTMARPENIRIEFKKRQGKEYIVADVLTVDPSNPEDVDQVARLAAEYLREHYLLFDADGRNLIPKTCFERVTANNSNTVLAIKTPMKQNQENEGKKGGPED